MLEEALMAYLIHILYKEDWM